MNTYLTSLFGLEGKVALLTGAGGHLVGELSRAAGLAGMQVVCCDLRFEDAQRTAHGIEARVERHLPTSLMFANQRLPSGAGCHPPELWTLGLCFEWRRNQRANTIL